MLLLAPGDTFHKARDTHYIWTDDRARQGLSVGYRGNQNVSEKKYTGIKCTSEAEWKIFAAGVKTWDSIICRPRRTNAGDKSAEIRLKGRVLCHWNLTSVCLAPTEKPITPPSSSPENRVIREERGRDRVHLDWLAVGKGPCFFLPANYKPSRWLSA